MRYSGYLVGVAAMALVAALPAVAQERFEPIGAATYTPRPAEEQYHTFEIPREYRNIRAVRFKIEEGTTEIRSFRVRYGEGDSERFRVGESYEAGIARRCLNSTPVVLCVPLKWPIRRAAK